MIKNSKINKLKLGLIGTVVTLSMVAGASVALAANLNYTSDTTVTVNSRQYTIQAGSAATSVVIAPTTLTVVVPASSQFVFSSPSRDTLTNDQSIGMNCGTSTSSVNVSGALTVIFTPTAVTCTPISGGSGLGGGGGGGGGGSSSSTTSTTSTTPSTTTMTVTSVDSGCVGGNKYSTTTGNLCGAMSTTTTNITSVDSGCVGGNKYSTTTGNLCGAMSTSTSTTTSITYNLGTVTLKNGSKGNAVMELQKLLNKLLNLGLVVDGKLGPKTIAVIKTWQKNHGLVADGLVGPKTKAAMNAEAEK